MTGGSSRPLLAVRDLRTWFETPRGMVRAVERISFEVAPGQAVGVVGESGSGKTQTFFSLFGLSTGRPGVVGGSAEIGGVKLLEGLGEYVEIEESGVDQAAVVRKNTARWGRLHRRRLQGILGRDVTVIFQEPRQSLIPYWTVGQHLRKALKRRGSSSSEHDLLARLGFSDPGRTLDALPEELSGGEAQRVMLALATAGDPSLLIADEPTTAVDAVSQVMIIEEIQRLHGAGGLAIVVISHDLTVLELLVDEVLVLFKGRLIERVPMRALAGSSSRRFHPYTEELRESQRRRAAALPIPLAVQENGGAPASGCPYASRCSLRPRLSPRQQVRCGAEMPPLLEVRTDHHVACWGLQP